MVLEAGKKVPEHFTSDKQLHCNVSAESLQAYAIQLLHDACFMFLLRACFCVQGRSVTAPWAPLLMAREVERILKESTKAAKQLDYAFSTHISTLQGSS